MVQGVSFMHFHRNFPTGSRKIKILNFASICYFYLRKLSCFEKGEREGRYWSCWYWIWWNEVHRGSASNNIKISRKKSAQGPTRITQKLGIPAPKTDCFLNVHVPGYVFFVFPPWFFNRFAKNKNLKFCFDFLLLPLKIELYQRREEKGETFIMLILNLRGEARKGTST